MKKNGGSERISPDHVKVRSNGRDVATFLNYLLTDFAGKPVLQPIPALFALLLAAVKE